MKVWKRITKVLTRNAGKRLAQHTKYGVKECVWCDKVFPVTDDSIAMFREDLRGDPQAGIYTWATDAAIAEWIDLCPECSEL